MLIIWMKKNLHRDPQCIQLSPWVRCRPGSVREMEKIKGHWPLIYPIFLFWWLLRMEGKIGASLDIEIPLKRGQLDLTQSCRVADVERGFRPRCKHNSSAANANWLCERGAACYWSRSMQIRCRAVAITTHITECTNHLNSALVKVIGPERRSPENWIRNVPPGNLFARLRPRVSKSELHANRAWFFSQKCDNRMYPNRERL